MSKISALDFATANGLLNGEPKLLPFESTGSGRYDKKQGRIYRMENHWYPLVSEGPGWHLQPFDDTKDEGGYRTSWIDGEYEFRQARAYRLTRYDAELGVLFCQTFKVHEESPGCTFAGCWFPVKEVTTDGVRVLYGSDRDDSWVGTLMSEHKEVSLMPYADILEDILEDWLIRFGSREMFEASMALNKNIELQGSGASPKRKEVIYRFLSKLKKN